MPSHDDTAPPENDPPQDLEPPFHDALPDPDDEGAVHVYITSELPCPSCGELFPVRLHADTLAMLERAGVSETEAMDAVHAGLHSRRIVCPECKARQN